MAVLESRIDRASPEFKESQAYFTALVAELRERIALVKRGGGEDAIAKHRARNKLLARERIETLCDPDTPFLEFNPLAAWEMYDGEAPSAGIVTGVGVIEGQECVIVANDATVKGGTYFPMTVKKHLRAQEIAEQNGLPCVYLVDSGGAFLPLQADVFPDRDHFGRIFYNQAQMSAKRIPQIAAVMGSCTAGGAYIPAMSDETVIVRGNGTIFLAGPPLVKAATGEEVTAEELGGADVHTPHLRRHRPLRAQRRARAGHRALDCQQPQPAQRVSLGGRRARRAEVRSARPLRHHPDRPAQELRHPRGHRAAGGWQPLPRVQGALRHDAGDGLRAHLRLSGRHHRQQRHSVLARARSRRRTSSNCAASARRRCIFLQNITGFMVGKQYEAGGIAKDGAKMVMAVANANVPKFTVIVGGSFGAGNYGMCGRAYAPRQLWMWPNARISVMGGEQAASTLLTVRMDGLAARGKKMSAREQEEFKAPILAKYEEEGNPYYSTARLWDDGILDPLDTRMALGLGIAAALNTHIPETTFGVFRM